VLIQLLIIKHLASIAAVIKPVLIELGVICLFTSHDKNPASMKMKQGNMIMHQLQSHRGWAVMAGVKTHFCFFTVTCVTCLRFYPHSEYDTSFWVTLLWCNVL